MGVINPIKDRQVIEKMKGYLREKNFRYYLLFRIGLNLGLPVNQLLELQVSDVLGKEKIVVNDYQVKICKSLQNEIMFFLGDRTEGYLFRNGENKPLTRFQLYNILKEAAEAACFRGSIGTLTLRKTFAYWAYKEQRIYLPLLSRYLNHHTAGHTLKYIGVDMERMEDTCLPEMEI